MAKTKFSIIPDNGSYYYQGDNGVGIQYDKIVFDTNNPTGYDIPLDDVIDACKSLGRYKGIIDVIFVVCDLRKLALKDAFEVLESLQNEFKDFVIVTARDVITGITNPEPDDRTNDVINLGPFERVDDNPHFAPYPYTKWTRYLYKSDNDYHTRDLIKYRSYRYRLMSERNRVTKAIKSIKSDSLVLRYYKEYLKELDEMCTYS